MPMSSCKSNNPRPPLEIGALRTLPKIVLVMPAFGSVARSTGAMIDLHYLVDCVYAANGYFQFNGDIDLKCCPCFFLCAKKCFRTDIQ